MRLPDDAQVSNEVINQPNMVNTRAKTRNTLKNCFLRHQLNSSAELIGSNDDILTEILLQLPVTSIPRFKSVSKHWRCLLTHPHFTLRYDKLPTSPGLFVNNKYAPFDVEDQSPPPLSDLDFCPDLHISWGSRFIPQLNCPRYKVVCILGSEYTYHMKIYYSETKEWKTLNINFSERRYYLSFGSGVYWNGAIHWDPYLVNITCHESRYHLTVYEMLGDHSGWFVKYEVGRDYLDCYPGIQSNRYDPYGGFDIIDVVRGEEEEDTFIVRYNVKDKSVEWLFDMTTADYDIIRFDRGKFHRYIQSLTSF